MNGGKHMSKLKKKLSSRKLWMSIASFTAMLMIYFGASESDAAQVSALIMAGASVIGYVIGEGIADNGNNYLQVIGEECEEKMEE